MPVRCISLEYRDYLRLLKSSTLALAMSQLTEGWSRNAHEAMLCGTPVLGSGKGGMSELLEGGRQLICDDPKALRATVNALVPNEERRIELGRAAYDFASQFTYERFRTQWVELVGRLC
jgi:glycosyltransferase involved in cell wall biosynthesis